MNYKLLISFFLFFGPISMNVFGQETNHYIISLEHDTLPVKILKTRLGKITCEINGDTKTYTAKKIVGYRNGDYIYDSGKVRDPGFLYAIRWVFFNRVVSGNANLYGYADIQKSISSTEGNPVYLNVYSEFIRLSSDERGMFLKLGGFWRYNLEKTLADCPQIIEKISQKGEYWGPDIEFFVRFYNQGCIGDINEFEK